MTDKSKYFIKQKKQNGKYNYYFDFNDCLNDSS